MSVLSVLWTFPNFLNGMYIASWSMATRYGIHIVMYANLNCFHSKVICGDDETSIVTT